MSGGTVFNPALGGRTLTLRPAHESFYSSEPGAARPRAPIAAATQLDENPAMAMKRL